MIVGHGMSTTLKVWIVALSLSLHCMIVPADSPKYDPWGDDVLEEVENCFRRVCSSKKKE